MPTKEERQAAREARQAARQAKRKDVSSTEGSTEKESSIPLFDENKVNARTIKASEKLGDLVTQTYDGSGKDPVITVTKQGEESNSPAVNAINSAQPTVAPTVAPAVEPSSKLSDIVSNVKSTAASDAVLDNAVKDAKSTSDLAKGVEIHNEVKDVEKKESAKTQAEITNDIKSQTNNEPNAPSSIEGSNAYGAAIANMDTSSIGGDGSMINGILINNNEGEKAPSYTASTNVDEVNKEIDKSYAGSSPMYDEIMKRKDNIPYAVVEKLGVQDYYPEVGRDIGVGTFTGSRIGSQTIYSGAGALLPMGLYDARKRALVAAAKERQTKLEKFQSLPTTLEPYQDKFNVAMIDELNSDMQRNGWDADRFSKDKEAMTRYYKRQALAKNITYVGTKATEILKAYEDGEYVLPEVRDMAYDYLHGAAEDFDKILSGEKDINKYAESFKSYDDGTKWAAEQLKDVWLKNPTEIPITMKGGELTEANMNELTEATKMYNAGGGYNAYASVLKKYYSLDVKPVVEAWALDRGITDEKVINNIGNYIQAQIPDASFVKSIELKDNKATEWAKINLSNRKFDWQKKEHESTYWGRINESVNDAVNKGTGKSLNQELAELNNKTKGKPSEAQVKALYQTYMPGVKVYKDKKSGGFAIIQPASGKLATELTFKDFKDLNGRPTKLMPMEYWNGKVWTYKAMTAQQIGFSKAKLRTYGTHSVLEPDDKKAWIDITDNGQTKVVGHEILKGFVSEKTGKVVYLNEDNLSEYQKSDKKITHTRDIEQAYIFVTKNVNGKMVSVPVKLKGESYGESVNISNDAGVTAKNEQSGYTVKDAGSLEDVDAIVGSGSGE